MSLADGIDMIKEGIKYDNEKEDCSLLSPVALQKLTDVLTYGKNKYTAHNWRKGIVYSRVLAACLRHIFAYMAGSKYDSESGLHHLAHAMCCIMFLLEYEYKQDKYEQYNDLYEYSKQRPSRSTASECAVKEYQGR